MSEDRTRDLSDLTEAQTAEIDAILKMYREGSHEPDYQDVGTLLVDPDATQGSIEIDVQSPVWSRLGQVGQIDVLADWISVLTQVHDNLLIDEEVQAGPYKLFGTLGAASLAPQCVLAQADQPYEFVEIDIAQDVERDPAYLKLNPHGRIPTLIDNGEVIIESAAICLYLADKHPESGLAPAIDSPDRAKYLQWMVYLTNTLQETMLLKIYSDRYTTATDADGVNTSASARLQGILDFLETSLKQQDGPFFLGNDPSTPDIYLNMLFDWNPDLENGSLQKADYPNIQHNYLELLKRPKIAKVFLDNGYA